MAAVVAQVEHEPRFLVAACAEVLQRCLPAWSAGIGVGSCLQQDEADAVVVIPYGLPERGVACRGIAVGGGSMCDEPGYNDFAALPGGYLQRGETVVQGIGIGSAVEEFGDGVLDALASLLVAAFVLLNEQP